MVIRLSAEFLHNETAKSCHHNKLPRFVYYVQYEHPISIKHIYYIAYIIHLFVYTYGFADPEAVWGRAGMNTNHIM